MDFSESIAQQLSKLISFPTVSASSNLGLLDYVEAEAARYKARIRRFPNATGTKANLLVSIGPDVPGGLVFSGHTDIVPTEGQSWTGDPWTMRRHDDRLIGRGATDMKGFLACCLAALPEIAARPLAKPIHLAFSYDEEVGCTGVGSMAEWLGKSGLAPRLAVVGEPTSMDLVSAHKGGMLIWTTVTGKPGHSSQPDRYVNAVMVAGDIIALINKIRAEMRDGPQVEGLDPPYSTIQVNQIEGGLHGNIVAEKCRFFWEMRIIPGGSDYAIFDRVQNYARDELEPAMKRVDASTGIAFDILARVPGLRPNGDPKLESELLGLLHRDRARLVPYGTEAGIFQNAGIPTVVIGPGDAADAHQPDESIECAELQKCADFLVRLSATCR